MSFDLEKHMLTVTFLMRMNAQRATWSMIRSLLSLAEQVNAARDRKAGG